MRIDRTGSTESVPERFENRSGTQWNCRSARYILHTHVLSKIRDLSSSEFPITLLASWGRRRSKMETG
eukprot:1925304-Pyramimonas_sp.AAC.1